MRIRQVGRVGAISVVTLWASAVSATTIGVTAGNSNGVGDAVGDPPRNSTPTPYNQPLVPGDIINIAVFGASDAAVGSNLGVATFELLFSYDPAVLTPRQYVNGGPRELLSEVRTLDSAHLEQWSWVADQTADGTAVTFPITAELTVDTGAHTVLLAGGADPDYRDLGTGGQPILLGQVAFDVLATLDGQTTALDVTGSAINAIGGFDPATDQTNFQLDAETANLTSTNAGVGQIAVGGAVILGDVNGDGVVDGLDIQPFVDLLTGGGYQAEADINADTVVDGLDIQPFVDIITGAGGSPVPEPATLGLLAAAGLLRCGRRRRR